MNQPSQPSPLNGHKPAIQSWRGLPLPDRDYGHQVTQRLLDADAEIALIRAQRNFWRFMALSLITFAVAYEVGVLIAPLVK